MWHKHAVISNLLNTERFHRKQMKIKRICNYNPNPQTGIRKKKKEMSKTEKQTYPQILQESMNLLIYLFALPDPSRQEGQQVIYLLLD